MNSELVKRLAEDGTLSDAGFAELLGTDAYDAEFMGSAVAFIANIHYYITDHLSMVPALKLYENWFKNVHCSRIDNNDLDPYLWQTFVLATVSIQYQF